MRAFISSIIVSAALLGGVQHVSAQPGPQLLSVSPANGASGVAVSQPVVFTFSEPMDEGTTYASFIDTTSFSLFDAFQEWNGESTILTCTPDPDWPNNASILWFVEGESLSAGDPLPDMTTGSFATGTGNTNQFTSFWVGKWYNFSQANATGPVPDADAPYVFTAGVTLASNRNATAVAVKYPTGVVTNISPNTLHPENFFAFDMMSSQTAFESSFPQGDYEFTVIGPWNPGAKVSLPQNMQQPNAPKIANFSSALAIDPNKPFTLSWDAFQGGTASDYIQVSVGDDFNTGEIGKTNALRGTATSVVIPAGTLLPNSTNYTTVSFWRYVATTNSAQAFTAMGYRMSTTWLDLITTAGGSTGSDLVVQNTRLVGTQLFFDATTTPGQVITLQSSSTLTPNSWQNVRTTNAPGDRVTFTVDIGNLPGAQLFRLKKGQ